jgi:hypothetical protein
VSDTVIVRQYKVFVCDLCVGGKGGECHVPGCAFWLRDAPEEARPLETQYGWIATGETYEAGK